jgi:hypothetical protein
LAFGAVRGRVVDADLVVVKKWLPQIATAT